jgi:hypothetical protein
MIESLNDCIIMKSTPFKKHSIKQHIVEYSAIEYVNQLKGEEAHIRNGERMLGLVFCRDYYSDTIEHRITICNVVQSGPLLEINRNGFLFVNLDSQVQSNKMVSRRINENRFIGLGGHIVDSNLSIHTGYTILNDLVSYNVRIHPESFLETIENRPLQVPSLKQLCVAAIPSTMLSEYNNLNKDYILLLK